jgi:precorrin-4/cobalt-precorrin-4 C11-methyltransferase
MVHFVGAGPGAKDLITIRGARLISEADMIIYAGSLVNPELLDNAKKDCRIYDSSRMNLEEIREIYKNSRDLDIVRLHTGDPSIYGAIKEQMEILESEHIPYDVCPGVSSMSGAAAVLKAEYTLPGVSQSVIITRMEGRTPVPPGQELSSFASHNSTLVIFLSAGLADEVRDELIKGGFNEDTPAAVVYKATWEDEKIIRTILKNLPEAMKDEGIDRTALIIVGRVLGSDHELSRLYDKNFSTGYRKADR